MPRLRAMRSRSAQTIQKASGALPTYQLRPKTACHGKSIGSLHVENLLTVSRVEKYRPDTLEDVSGHQDILATINKFVDTNVSETSSFSQSSSDRRRDFPTYSSMALPARVKRPLSSLSRVESMARICGRWFWNSTPRMIVVSTLCGNRSRPLPARSRSST